MDLNSLRPPQGSTKNRKRIGRGTGSGHGKTATKGHKGQKARSGGSIKAGFEGGQMPMQRRLPKRGFNPLNKKIYTIVNLSQLESFESGSNIDAGVLVQSGIVKDIRAGIKILADGELTKALVVKDLRVSAAAKEKIQAAGGTVQEL
jgi:large subunit ribosomal protein L15